MRKAFLPILFKLFGNFNSVIPAQPEKLLRQYSLNYLVDSVIPVQIEKAFVQYFKFLGNLIL